MGLRVRKSVKLGPLRLNASKSGLGASVGVKGFRVTKTAKGKIRTTASIPGSGISFVQETGKSRTGGQSMKTTRQPNKKRRWIWVGAIALLLLIGAIGAKGGGASPEPSPTPTAELRAAVETTPAPTVKPQAEPTPTPARQYVLNTSSHVFHRPGCSAADSIGEDHREEYEGFREDLIAQGYTPCGRCNP